MKVLLTLVLALSSQSILASGGGGGGGSNYGADDLSATINDAQASLKSSPMSLVKSLSKDQKSKLMEILKDPKQLKKLQSLLK